MPSVNIQFREDQEVVDFVEGRGLRPSQLAKEAFEREVRRLRAQEHARELQSLNVKLPPGFAERAVREDRDAR